MAELKEHSLVVFVVDKRGQSIPEARVDVIVAGEPIASATTVGDYDRPIRIHLSENLRVVDLQAVAKGITKRFTVDVTVGTFTFKFNEIEMPALIPDTVVELSHAKWVLSLHGIRTRGAWQKELTNDLNAADLKHDPLDYGFFRGIRLLVPSLRQKQLAWFRERYTHHINERGSRPSVIAHSFGSYLVARSMEKFPEIQFDQIVLCGSIVAEDYPWTRMIPQQCSRVLNDFGRKDFWAKIAEWLIDDAGASGSKGFSDEAECRVIQRKHNEFKHSDYFYSLNYRRNWIPFLKGGEPGHLGATDRRPRNWRYLILRTILLILLVAVLLVSALGLYRMLSGKRRLVSSQSSSPTGWCGNLDGVWEQRERATGNRGTMTATIVYNSDKSQITIFRNDGAKMNYTKSAETNQWKGEVYYATGETHPSQFSTESNCTRIVFDNPHFYFTRR